MQLQIGAPHETECGEPAASGAQGPDHARQSSASSLQLAFARSLPTPDWPQVGHGRIVVALVDLRQWRGWLTDAAALIDAVETARVARQRFPIDRETRILSYALHRLLLGAACGMDAVDVPLGRDELGCPVLGATGPGRRKPDSAGRVNSMRTSLSHCGGYAAFAVTAGGPVGVDVEPLSNAAVIADLAPCVCTSGEDAALRGLPERERRAGLLALWVRKEALLKAAGIGLAREMSGFAAPAGRVLAMPAGEGSAVIRMLDAGNPCVAAVAAAPGHVVDWAWLRPE